jgi:hypothetical protein
MLAQELQLLAGLHEAHADRARSFAWSNACIGWPRSSIT